MCPVAEQRPDVFVDHARRYAELGWVLLPLNGKVPRGRRWQQTTADRPELAAGKWSQWGKTANVGCLLGPSGVVVVEPDTPAAADRLLELLGGRLPDTPTVQSGGKSIHLYFQDDGLGNAERDGLELRAGSQQCVLPPSIHPDTGRAYEWLEGRSPWQLPPGPVPAAVRDYLSTTRVMRAAPVEDLIREGGRHRTLLSLAGSMRHRGLGLDEIAAALQVTNRLRCRPPLPDDEIVGLAADVVRRYQPKPPDPARDALEAEADRLLAAWDTPPPPEQRASPLIVPLVTFLGGTDDDATWLVDHLAAKAALVIVAGLPKVGKSTFVYGMLGALTGIQETFAGLQAGSTGVLLMTEEPPATVEEKVDRFGIDEDRVFVLSKRRIRLGRKWASTVKATVAWCRTHPEIGLVVVDTLDKFADLDAKRSEADTGVIRETIDPLYELLELGVCVILITHQRKEEGSYGLRVRGGTALVGSADVIVEVERPAPAAGLGKGARVVKLVSRFAGAPDEIAVELDENGWRPLGSVGHARRRLRREQMLMWLTAEPLTIEQIHETAGGEAVSPATLRRRIDGLVKDGLVDRSGDGVKGDPWRWRLSQSATEFVSTSEKPVETNAREAPIHAETFVASKRGVRGAPDCNETETGVTKSP